MKNLWKRSLSLLLALVMVLGILPMGIQVKAAGVGGNLDEANGVIWLVKDENFEIMGQKLGITKELMDAVTGGKLDDMIREALRDGGMSVKDSDIVTYDNQNVETIAENAFKLMDMGNALKEAITDHQLITFTVGGKDYQIAFRNHTNLSFAQYDADKVVEKEADKYTTLTDTLVIKTWGVPADKTAKETLIESELENLRVAHNGYVSLTKGDAEWKITNNGTKLTLTVKSDDNGAVKSVTLNVVFEDIRPEYTVNYYVNGELYKNYTIKDGDATKVPADPQVDGSYFFGWHNSDEAVAPENVSGVADTVTADANYYAVLVETQVVKFHFLMSDGRVYGKEIAVALTKEGNWPESGYPQAPVVDGYIGEGWFYIDNGEYVEIDLETGDKTGITDVYYIFCTDADNDGIGDGMPVDPRYIYDFYIYVEGEEELVLGETVVLVAPIATVDGIAAPEVFEYDPRYLGLYLSGWAVYEVEKLNLGGITKYEVKPVTEVDENMNGTADSDENDKVNFAGVDGLTAKKTAQNGEIITYTWYDSSDVAKYQSTVEISGLTSEGKFVYTAGVTSVKVSPLWKIEDGTMGYYPTAIGSEEIYYEDNYACNKLSDVALAFVGDDLEITYAKVGAFTFVNPLGTLEAGKTYTEADVYGKVIADPAYDKDKVEVLYAARIGDACDVEINFDVVYYWMRGNIFAEYADMLEGKTKTWTLDTKWVSIENSAAPKDAQSVANEFFNEVIADIVDHDYNVTYAYNRLNTLEQELLDRLNAEANLNRFLLDNVQVDKEGKLWENLDITYNNGDYALNARTKIEVKDDRLATELSVKEDKLTFDYKCFTDADLMANVVLKDEKGNKIEGATLSMVNFYPMADAGTYTVEVIFNGNEAYKKAEPVSFKLVINKVAPKIEIPSYVITFDDDYDYAPVVTPASADIVQIIAGVKASELTFDKDLTIADNEIEIDVWVKMPAMIIKLLNGMEIPGTGKVIEFGKFYTQKELEQHFDKLKGNDATVDRAIAAVEAILDKNMVDRVLNRLGLGDEITHTLVIRLDAIEDKFYPTAPGMYVNFAASTAYLADVLADYTDYASLFKNDNYIVSTDYPSKEDLKGLSPEKVEELKDKVKNLSADGGIIVYAPMIAIPNDGGVQIYDGEVSNAQNVFVYEYNGQPVNVDLEVAVNGEKIEDAEPFYFGLSNRMDLKKSAPTMPGVYVAGYNYTTTVYNEDTQEFEVKRLGSDSCIIVIKQQAADLTITGGTFEYDGTSKLPEIKITDKNGNKISDSGMTIISGTVNVKTGDSNVTANDLYGAVNVDFPAALTIPMLKDNAVLEFMNMDDAWAYYREKILNKAENDKITPNDLIAFLEFCSEKTVAANEYVVKKFKDLGVDDAVMEVVNGINKVQDKFEVGTGRIEAELANIQNLLKNQKGSFDQMVAELKPYAEKLDDNCYITFKNVEDLDYSATGYYLYVGVITDPDLTVDAAKGLVIIKSADDYEMADSDKHYNGKPQSIDKIDNTGRDDVMVVMDRANDAIVAVDAENKIVHIQVDEEMAQVILDALNKIDGVELSLNSDVTVGTVYTKTEKFASDLTDRVIKEIKERAEAKVLSKIPYGTEIYDETAAYLKEKLDVVTAKVSAKLQQLDNLDNGTTIVINGLLPVDLATFEVTTLDFNVNEINIVIDGDVLNAVNAALAKAGYEMYQLNDGTDGYVVTGYEKAEDVAKIITEKVFEELTKIGMKAIEKMPFEVPGDLEHALKVAENKLVGWESDLLAKMQTMDGMDNFTRIVINGQLPVNVGTYDFYGYDYDVAAARGTLTIHPVKITVAFDDDFDYSMVVNGEEPDLKATAKITYSCEETGLNTTVWPTADAMAQVFTYDITRAAGDAVGSYPMNITAELLGKHATSGNYIIEVAPSQDFQILPVGTIGSGKATLSLEGEVFIEYMPAIEGFEGIDLTGKGGIAIWTGEGRPASSSLIMPDADNCVTLNNMYWSDLFNTWAVTTTGINAKEYGDLLYFRAFIEVSEGVYVTGPAAYYSPEMYCEDKLNNSTDIKLKEVCASLLDYGTVAQEYFDYNLDALVNAGWDFSEYDLAFDETMLDELDPVESKTGTLTGTKEKIGSAKATLTLEGAIVIEVVYPNVTAEDILYAELLVWNESDYNATEDFSYDAANYTYKVPLTKGNLVGIDGYVASLKYQGADGRYAGIPAKEIGDTVYFAAYVVTESGIYRSGMGTYSPDYYAKQMLNHSDPELVSVVKALAVYSEKARAYFNYYE